MNQSENRPGPRSIAPVTSQNGTRRNRLKTKRPEKLKRPPVYHRRYPHLMLTAGACNRYRSIAGTRRPQGAQQQTSRKPLLLSINGTETDGQTDTRPLHRPSSVYYAARVTYSAYAYRDSVSLLRAILTGWRRMQQHGQLHQ